ncbi:hypothetical protein As57867_020768, partial [Aphanomyces stellatus]
MLEVLATTASVSSLQCPLHKSFRLFWSLHDPLRPFVPKRVTGKTPTSLPMHVRPQHAADASDAPSQFKSSYGAPPIARSSLVLSALGCVYIGLSTASSSWYLVQLAPSFQNDLWWVGYSASGHQALMIDVFNTILTTQASGAVNILAPRWTMDKSYHDPQSTTEIRRTYARRLVLLDLTSIEYAVLNLRSLTPTWTVSMSTQTCWVDLNHEFELALTAARQQRCVDLYQSNGAVYIETVLRNQNWDQYIQMYGGDNGIFTIAIQTWLAQVPSGQAWLAATAAARRTTSVAQEAAYWHAHNLTSFQLQWQNSFQTGVGETILVKNALGLTYEIGLKKMSQLDLSWPSIVMNCNLLNEMLTMQALDRSLVRSATNSYTQPPVINPEDLLGLQDGDGNYVAQIGLFRATVGPYLAVDMYYIDVPPSLLSLYNAFQDALYATLDNQPGSLQATLDAIPAITFTPTPPAWQDPTLNFYGGNPMCFVYGPLPYVQDT